jgi:acetoin utilization protein AcuB
MKVKDRMTRNVVTVRPDNSLKEALDLMKQRFINRLPVIDNGVLVGIIVKNDIEKALHRPGCYPETPVSWIMSQNIITVHPDDDLVSAAAIFKNRKISALPVLDGNNLVGIITDTDVIKTFIEIMQTKSFN